MTPTADWTTGEMTCELEDRSYKNNPNLSRERKKRLLKKQQRPPVTCGATSSSPMCK